MNPETRVFLTMYMQAGVTPMIRHVPPAVLKGASAALKPFRPGVSRILYVGSLPDDAYDERFDPSPLRAESRWDSRRWTRSSASGWPRGVAGKTRPGGGAACKPS